MFKNQRGGMCCMSHYEATKLLDRFKDGTEYPLSVVNRALFLTGDIDGHQLSRMDGGNRGAGVDCPIQPQGSISRTPRSTQLVDRCN